MTDTRDPRRSSWLKIDDTTEPKGGVATLWDECQARLGYVRTFLKLPFEADRLSLFQGYINRLMRSDDCKLSGVERELVALIVSLENRCPPCIITHAGALKAHGMPAETVDIILANWRHAPLSDRERALADYASDLTVSPDQIEESDLDPLRDVGLTELEILETAQIVAIFNATNRLNNGLGVAIDAPSHSGLRAG
ncbi:MAG: peroxidase-related enzyme [Pseudomonadota bacterium]